jgi:hypothetical protein
VTPHAKPDLTVVRDEPSDRPSDLADDIYAAGRAKANDREHWRRLHERGDRREPVFLTDRPKRRFLSRGGFQFELRDHGHKFEERR